MTPLGALFIDVCRMFPRVFSRVRGFIDSFFGVHPRRLLGGTGGPVAPFGGGSGDATLPRFSYDTFKRVYLSRYHSPLVRGDKGGSAQVLLDLPVLTDTKSVGVCCDMCGLPLQICRCIVGLDY